LNSLQAKSIHIQDGNLDEKQVRNGLNSLENQVEAQSGKHIDQAYIDILLSEIRYLKQINME
jgi:hypothetical protein